MNAAVSGVALCGTLAGQLFFGWLGDKMGRKRVYGITLLLMIVCSIASALSFGSTAKSVITTLCFFRFWLGFGIGGDYPLSATIMSEYANTRTRGAFIAAVFAMQGFGILCGGAVAIIVAAGFNHTYSRGPYNSFPTHQAVDKSCPPQADFVWRIILGVGALPAAATFYYRMKMPETARYTALVAGNAKKAALDMTRVLEVNFDPVDATVEHRVQYGLLSKEFVRQHGRQLLGTTSCWFLLDIAFYSSNLFQKDIFSAVGWLPSATKMSAIEEVFKIARAQAVIACFSTVPGYWFTVALIDHVGRFKIQLQGFFFMTVFMFALAIPYDHWKSSNHTGFVALYAFTFFFSNFGPNATTFIVPAELFPARLRSTCHGISAAAGKAGAIVGTFGFLYAAQDKDPAKRDSPNYPAGIGMKYALIVLGIINACGFCCTFLVPETNQRSLEDLSGENEEAEADKRAADAKQRLSEVWGVDT